MTPTPSACEEPGGGPRALAEADASSSSAVAVGGLGRQRGPLAHAPLDAPVAVTAVAGGSAVLAGGASATAARADVEMLLVLACGVVAALLALANAPPPLRLYPGLAAVLVLPGWSLRLALFPRRLHLGGVERLSLSLALSVAVVTALSLALGAVPGGLSRRGMVAGITAWTLAALAAAWVRRRGMAANRPRGIGWLGALSTRSRASVFAGWVLAASLLVASLALAAVVGAPEAESTEFSMMGAEGLMEQYPRVIGPGPVVVAVAVTSHRQTSATYRIVARLDGTTLASVGPMTLAPGATWRGPMPFTGPALSGDRTIEFLLYEGGRPGACCRLWLRMRADAGPNAGGSASR